MLKNILSKITYAIWKVVEFFIDLMLPTDCWKCYLIRIVMFVMSGMFLGVMYSVQIEGIVSEVNYYG